MAPTVRGVEPPKQARSRESYRKILDATYELLAEHTFDAITVDAIVERAGYTKGAFYCRFDSKATLLRHLVAQLTAGALDAWDEFLDPRAWDGVPLEDVLAAFIARLVAIYTRSTNVMRAFSWEVEWGTDEALRETAARLNGRVSERLSALLTARAGELRPQAARDLEGAVGFWLEALVAVLRATFLWPSPQSTAAEDPAHAERRIRDLMVPYLVPAASLRDAPHDDP